MGKINEVLERYKVEEGIAPLSKGTAFDARFVDVLKKKGIKIKNKIEVQDKFYVKEGYNVYRYEYFSENLNKNVYVVEFEGGDGEYTHVDYYIFDKELSESEVKNIFKKEVRGKRR